MELPEGYEIKQTITLEPGEIAITRQKWPDARKRIDMLVLKPKRAAAPVAACEEAM